VTKAISIIEAALGAWRLDRPVRIEPLEGGFNSQTWRVSCPSGYFVAKLAPNASTFEAGLMVAEQLEQIGFQAGGPIRTVAGALTVPLGGETLALLRFERGEPLDPTRADDLRIWGQTMARFHSLSLQMRSIPAGLPHWPWAWLDPTEEHLRIEPWIRPAIERVLAEVGELEASRQLTVGIVHGDAAEPLIDRATGEWALIDWGAAMWGPLLYDVASACWYIQFKYRNDSRDLALFLEAFRQGGPLPADELKALDAFVRLRCAVQAFYFAWRIANNIGTGLTDLAENQKGLDEARMAWEQLD
jgi:homoserine kinase type II